MSEYIRLLIDVLVLALELSSVYTRWRILYHRDHIKPAGDLSSEANYGSSLLAPRNTHKEFTMATTIACIGLTASDISVSNEKFFNSSLWEIVDTTVITYEREGFTPLQGSRTLFRYLSNIPNPVTVRIEVNPGRDADGTPKYNCSIRWNGRVTTDVDGVETKNDPTTAVLAWTSIETPLFGGDSDQTFQVLSTLLSWVAPDVVAGAIDRDSMLDRIGVGITSIDLSNVIRS